MMGWKLVRDGNEEWCKAHGVSGQWRVSPDPAAALRKKIGEEYGEYIEKLEVGELFDLLDVVQAAIRIADPLGFATAEHRQKVADYGGFTQFIEWCPRPAEQADA